MHSGQPSIRGPLLLQALGSPLVAQFPSILSFSKPLPWRFWFNSTVAPQSITNLIHSGPSYPLNMHLGRPNTSPKGAFSQDQRRHPFAWTPRYTHALLLCTIYSKLTQNINSKCVQSLHLKAKVIKFLEENKGVVNLCDFRLGNDLLDMTPKAQATTKRDKQDFTKMKNLYAF